MRIDGEISSFKKIKRGVRQGNVLSTGLFSLHREMIMWNLEGNSEIKEG